MRKSLLVLILLILVSCKTSIYSLSGEEQTGLTQQTFNQPYEDIYQASLNSLSTNNWIIENTDKESRIITSEKRYTDIISGDHRMKATIQFQQIDEQQTKVKVNSNLQAQLNGWNNKKVTKKIAEEHIKPFFETVETDLSD